MWLKSSSHYKVPIQIILFAMVVIGGLGYSLAGEIGAENLIIASLIQAVGQFPAGLLVILICSRIFTFDFGTIGTISLKIFSISMFEEAVGMGAHGRQHGRTVHQRHGGNRLGRGRRRRRRREFCRRPRSVARTTRRWRPSSPARCWRNAPWRSKRSRKRRSRR